MNIENNNKIATRESYGKALKELGKENENIVVLDADLAGATKTIEFAKEFPDRFFDMGIAEQDMMGTAVGLASFEKIPYVSTFAMFAAGRAYDQIRNSIAHTNSNVKICATHAGITVGEDGATHQMLEDINMMKCVPRMIVMSTSDDAQTKWAVKEIAKIENSLDEKKIELAKWMANRYFCNISECIKQMLPPGTTSSNITKRVNEKKQNFVSLIKEPEEIEEDIINHVLKSEKQIRALKFLMENDEVSSVDLQNFSDVSLAILKTLEKNGYIEIYEKEVERNPFIHKVVNKTTNLALNEEQQEAFEKINASIQFNEYDEFLLFGVTGSRKNRNIYSTYRRDFKAGKIKYSIGSRNITNASNCR